MDLARAHWLPSELASRATDIGTDWHSASSTEIPVHCRVIWPVADGTEVVEVVWGLLQAWTSLAIHVWLRRHGEQHVWLRREDVRPCRCLPDCAAVVPVDDASAIEPSLCTMP